MHIVTYIAFITGYIVAYKNHKLVLIHCREREKFICHITHNISHITNSVNSRLPEYSVLYETSCLRSS